MQGDAFAGEDILLVAIQMLDVQSRMECKRFRLPVPQGANSHSPDRAGAEETFESCHEKGFLA